MKRSLSLISVCIFVFLLVAASACERKGNEIGGSRGVNPGTPAYTASAPSVSAIPGDVIVQEVSVAGPGGKIDGAKLFQANCAACHQATGQGVPGAFPPLDGSEYVVSDNVERMASIMVYGLMGPITVKGQQYSSVMTPMGALKDAELAAIATYVRSAWSNKAGPVDASVFEKVRKKWGTRGQFNINELDAK